MANNTFSLYGAKLDSNVIGGITDMSGTPGVQALVQGASGAAVPSYGGIMMQDARINLTTLQIAQMIGLCGVAGYAPSTSADFAFQLNAPSGTRSGTYRKLGAYGSFVVPRRLSLAQNREATLTVEVFAFGGASLSNGPFSVGTGSLSWTQAITEKFTLGPMEINGTAIEPQSIDLDFGLNVEVDTNSGTPWNLGAHVESWAPKIDIVTFDQTLLDTFLPGAAGGAAVTLVEFFAQKVSEGGGHRVAAATAEHVKFTLTDGLAYVSDAGGGHGAKVPMTVRVEGVYDGTNAILQVDTTAAIAFT